jgi:beta-glucosidase
MKKNELSELLKKMSIKEKVGQLFQPIGFAMMDDPAITGPLLESFKMRQEDVDICGTVLGMAGAKNARKIQQDFIDQHPHKIPLIFMLDVINGFRTIYPIPLAQAASFSPELAEECARMAAREAAASGVHVTFSPMVDLVRDARWGRVMESTGEDVWLSSQFAAAVTKGYQGKDIAAADTLGACVKHFAGYGAPVAGRDYNTVQLTERTLREYYLPAYKAAIDAGAALVMTSFNTIDDIPATGNKKLMRDILREEMRFDGVLISDFNAIGELVNHGLAADLAEAARMACEAGVDIDMMSSAYINNLEKLIEDKVVDESLLDESVMRVLELKNKLGLFENPFKGADEKLESELILCDEHRALARQAAEKSFVLLKNEGQILPLSEDEKIAFVGPYVDNKNILGAWSIMGKAEDAISVQEAAERILSGWDISINQGSPLLDADVKLEGFRGHEDEVYEQAAIDKMLEEAVTAARTADKVVLFLGEHVLQSGEATSRGQLDLPHVQLELLQAVAEVNTNIVVVLFNGRPLDLRMVQAKSAAILEVWMPGVEGGTAIVNTLTGQNEPVGRLPMTFPYSVGQVPIHYDTYSTGRPHRPGQDKDRFVSKYLDIPNKPLYPFGFGLSYTRFEYSEVVLDTDVLAVGSTITAAVRVTNIGDTDGTTLMQLYIHDVAASVARPVKQLKDTQHVRLAKGETQEISFRITEEMLRFNTADGRFDSEAGQFEVYIGDSSETENVATFRLEK